ncbi:hypothetical protein ACXM2N_08935 [Corynebacterium sp. ZY180755]
MCEPRLASHGKGGGVIRARHGSEASLESGPDRLYGNMGAGENEDLPRWWRSAVIVLVH